MVRRVLAVVVSVAAGIAVAIAVHSDRPGPRPDDGAERGGTTPSTSGDAKPGISHETASPPPFVRLAHRAPVPRDPADPGYSSLRLAQSGASLAEVFAEEPRVDPWARDMEDSIATRLAEDAAEHLPDATELAVECHAAVCEMSGAMPAGRIEELVLLFQAPARGDMTTFGEIVHGSDGTARATAYLAFSQEHHTPTNYSEWVAKRRARFEGELGDLLESVRGQRAGEENNAE